MRYTKAFGSAFLTGLKGFGAMYLLLSLLNGNVSAILLTYYSFALGCAGIIGEALNNMKKVKK